MNPHSGTNDANNNIRKTKAIAAIPMAGIIVTVALVSGLVSFMGNSYQPAIAQTGNATTTMGGGQFPCGPAQTGGGGGGETTTGGGTVGSGGAGGGGTAGGIITGSGTTTTGGAASTDMNTTGITDEGNQAIGEVAIHIQEACAAAHNNDIPDVLLHLNLALDALNAVRGGGATNATAELE
jgi:hypothetical protein